MENTRSLKLVLVTTLMMVGLCHGGEVTRIAEGSAVSKKDAINDAIALALEQHYGAQINTDTRRELSDIEKFASSDGKEAYVTRMNSSLAGYITKNANGRILGYEVLETNEAEGRYNAKVEVRFPGPYVVGLDPNNRRKMVVTTFRSTDDNWAKSLSNKLNEQLTQSRKFTMLDRDYSAEVAAEIAAYSAADANPEEARKLCQKLGTDYLVVGSITFHDVPAPTTNPYTGDVTTYPNALFAEVSYRVLLAPTGQLKWADSFNVSASMTVDQAAMGISASILSAILPFEIVGKTGEGLLVIGQGGKTVFVGERMQVFGLGEKVTDSRTGEVLDYIENDLGLVEIVRVTEKLSYAKVISGDISKMNNKSRVRRYYSETESVEASPAQSSDFEPLVKPVEGGVYLPF